MARPAVALFSSPPGETLKARPGALAALRSDRPEDWTLEQQTSSEVFARDMRQTDEDHVGPWPPLALWGGSGWGGHRKILGPVQNRCKTLLKKKRERGGCGDTPNNWSRHEHQSPFLVRRKKSEAFSPGGAHRRSKPEDRNRAGSGCWVLAR